MAIYLSNRDGNGKTSEEGHYKLPLNSLKGNVLSANDFSVTQSPTPAMSVRVSAGVYRIPDVSGNYAYSGWSTDFETLSIPTADAANPRLSTVVLYVDKTAPTNSGTPNNPGITKLIVVNGGAATVPVAPTNTEIQTAVGTGNPYITLANVRTNAAATSIVNANITDLRVRVGIIDDVLAGSNIGAVIGNLMYPVGSIYVNKTVATNPGTLLGFGTWVALEGRTVVGKAASGTFVNAGDVGGAETHTLTTAQMPSHDHATQWRVWFPSGTGSLAINDRGGDGIMVTDNAAGGEFYSDQRIMIQNEGGGAAHNNLQPYVVAYMWERTA